MLIVTVTQRAANLENLSQPKSVLDNDGGLLVEDGDADEQVEVVTGQHRPQHLPQALNVGIGEFALELHE